MDPGSLAHMRDSSAPYPLLIDRPTKSEPTSAIKAWSMLSPFRRACPALHVSLGLQHPRQGFCQAD